MNGYIAVDLDGTLAHYDQWRGPDHIGAPIKPMMDRVKAWLAEGKEVRIFTARACMQDQVPPVEKWLKEQGLPALVVTNAKDYGMIVCYDDRSRQVETNTGRVIGE